MFDIIIGLTSVIFCLATLVPISNLSHWSIRDLDFPKLQFSCALVINLTLLLLFCDLSSPAIRVLIVLTLACLLYQLWWIRPYTIFHRKEVPHCENAQAKPSITLLNSNVLMPNRNADDLLRLIHDNDPDIIITLESDKWWESALAVLDEQGYVHNVKCALDNLYGMHVFSRLKLHQMRVEYLVEKDIPSIHGSVELNCGNTVQVHFLHPAPPSPTENDSSSERDAELIIVAKKLANHVNPVIVTGDLNDVAWSKTTRIFRQLSGLRDPRIGRGMFNTFHAQYWFMRWPLDHLFHSNHFTLHTIKRLRLKGSDHFALLTRLCLEHPDNTGDNPQALDADEQSLVKDRLQKHKVTADNVPSPQ